VTAAKARFAALTKPKSGKEMPPGQALRDTTTGAIRTMQSEDSRPTFCQLIWAAVAAKAAS
jgi:hypothetical protein